MSTTIMAICWPLRMPPTVKSVLISLADNANDQGDCWPSLTTICERTCLGRTAVIDAIKWLEAESLLVADRSNGRHSRYQITVAQLRLFNAKPVRRTDRSATQTGTADELDQSATRTAPVRQADSIRQEPPRTKEQEQKPQRRARAAPALTFVPPDWIDGDAWTGYLEMRRKKRAPPTDHACELVVAELERLRRLGHDPTKVLEQSTRSSWTDVYPLKTQVNSNANGSKRGNLSAVERVEDAIRQRRERDGEAGNAGAG